MEFMNNIFKYFDVSNQYFFIYFLITERVTSMDSFLIEFFPSVQQKMKKDTGRANAASSIVSC